MATITIPEGVKTIGDYAFAGCSSIATLAIPDGVTRIGACAFYRCSDIATLSISEGVETIGDYAFDDCTSVTAITSAHGSVIMESGEWVGQGEFVHRLRHSIAAQASKATVALGATFSLDASLFKLDQLCNASRARATLFDPTHFATYDANSSAYGEGVTRQWLLDLAKALLGPGSGLVVESQCVSHQQAHAMEDDDTATAGNGAQLEEEWVVLNEASGLVPGATVEVQGRGRFRPLQMNGKVGVALSFDADKSRWAVRFEAPAQTVLLDAKHLIVVALPADQALKARARWTAIRALTRFVLRKHRAKLMHTEQVVSLSPLTDLLEASLDAKMRLRGLGRVIGATLVRSEPIGFVLSASFCKLLVGQEELVSWRDLEAVLPALQFAPLAACLEGGLAPEEQREKFDYFVEHGLLVDVDEGEEATFAMPSRQARAFEKEHPASELPQVLRAESALEDGGEAKRIIVDNVGEFAAAWARKELVLNTKDQLAAVKQGISDIDGADENLASFTTAGGWQALQRRVRGATGIDVAEWREITTHTTADGGPDAAAACDLFWELVGELSPQDRIKLLHFWCAELPPAGGVKGLGSGSSSPLALVLKRVVPGAALPRAATCFRQLKVAATKDKEEMRELIAIAVAHYTDFGLT